MHILIQSYLFHPSVGGSETAASLLAHGFARRGHRVVVLTRTPAAGPDEFPFTVVRAPRPWQLIQWVRWSDVVVHSNISLRAAWPLLVLRRPWVVIHHTRLTRPDGRFGVAVEHFCYPFGDVSPAVRDLVAEAGYRTACGVEPGLNGAGTDPFGLRRFLVRHHQPGLLAHVPFLPGRWL